MANVEIHDLTNGGTAIDRGDYIVIEQVGITKMATIGDALDLCGTIMVSDYVDLDTAVAAVSTGHYIIVIDEAISVTANLIIPATVTIKKLYGGMITVPNGITLTINGVIEGRGQIFNLEGTGTLSGTPLIDKFYFEWIGFANSATTDQGVLLDKMFNMFDNMEYVATAGYSYAYGSAISVSTKNAITINGNHGNLYDLGKTIDVSGVGIADQRTFVGMTFDDVDELTIKDFGFYSNNDSGAYTAVTGTDVTQGIRITNSGKVRVHGIDLNGYVGPIIDTSALPVGTKVVDYQRSGFIAVGSSNDVEVWDCELMETSGNGEIFIFGDNKRVKWHDCRCNHGYNTTDLTNGGFTAGSIVAQTSGKLIIGRTYIIDTYVAGDDFTNVGGTNTSGTVFVATGIAPTTWSNSSSLRGAPGRNGSTTFWSFGKVINCDNQVIEHMDISSWSSGSFIDISCKDRADVRDITLGLPLGGFLDVTQEWGVCNIDIGDVYVENISGVYKTGIFSTCAATASAANDCSVNLLSVKNTSCPNGLIDSIAKHTFIDGVEIVTPIAATTHQNIGVLTYPREDRNYDYPCDCHISKLNAYGTAFNFGSWKGITTVSDSVISTPVSTAAPGTIIIKSQLERQNVGSPITSGTVTTGQRYWIETFVAGDDFTNIGGTNTSGTIFVATGTTPTTWTHSSILHTIGIYGYTDPEQKVVFDTVTFKHAYIYIRTNVEFYNCTFYDCKIRTGGLGYDLRLNVYFDANCKWYGIGHDTLVSTVAGWMYNSSEGDYSLSISDCQFLGSVENSGAFALLTGLEKSTKVFIGQSMFDVSRYSSGSYIVMRTVSYTNTDPGVAGKTFTFKGNHLQGLSNGINFVGTAAISPTYHIDFVVDGNSHTSTNAGGALLSTSGTSLDCLSTQITNNTSTVQDVATAASAIATKDYSSLVANNNGPTA